VPVGAKVIVIFTEGIEDGVSLFASVFETHLELLDRTGVWIAVSASKSRRLAGRLSSSSQFGRELVSEARESGTRLSERSAVANDSMRRRC
jgi:hypothetical protein